MAPDPCAQKAIEVCSGNCEKYGKDGIEELFQTLPIDGFLNKLFDGRLKPLTKEIIQETCGEPLTVVYSHKNMSLEPCICELKLYVDEASPIYFVSYDLKNSGHFVTCMFSGESFPGHAMLSDESFLYAL
jgi:hypothetical protein